jgi:hypothetical protein
VTKTNQGDGEYLELTEEHTFANRLARSFSSSGVTYCFCVSQLGLSPDYTTMAM